MMRKAILAFVLTAVSAMSVWAQVKTEIAGAIQPATTVPSGACTRRNAIRTYANKIYICPQSGTATWTEVGSSATGDVVGPVSSTDNAVARFDSTTGKLLQNSVVTIGDTGNVAGVGTLTATSIVQGQVRDIGGQVYNAKAYVAGDNVTDDTAAWASFLASITNYSVILLPPGFKSLVTNIDLSGRKGLKFLGTNAGAEAASTHTVPVIKMTGAAGGSLITCSPCQSIVFEGILFDGANLADKVFNASYNAAPTYDVTFRRVQIHNASGGGASRTSFIGIDWCGTGTTSNCERLVVENSTLYGPENTSIGVRIGHSNSLNNKIEGSNISNFGKGVSLLGSAIVQRNLFNANVVDVHAQLAESVIVSYNRTENGQQFFNGNAPVTMTDNVFGTHGVVTADAWIDIGKTSTDAFLTFFNNTFVNDDTLPPFSTGLTSSIISKHNRYPVAAVSSNRVMTMANFGRGYSSEYDTYNGGIIIGENRVTSPQTITLDDTTNNSVLTALNLYRRTSSGSAPTTGMGSALTFQIANSANGVKDAARVAAAWTSAGAGAETAYLSGSVTNSGTLTEYWRWLPGGFRAVAAGQDFGSATQAVKDIYLYGSGTYGSHSIQLTGTPTGNRVQTFPNNTGTVANLNLAQTWTATQTVSSNLVVGSVSPAYPFHVEQNAGGAIEVGRIRNTSAGGIGGLNFANDLATVANGLGVGGSTAGAPYSDNFILYTDPSAGSRNIRFLARGASAGVDIYTGGTTLRWSVSSAGNILAGADSTYSIGAAGANRPLAIHVGATGVLLDKTITTGGTTGDQTINKSSFTVNFATAATTITVTNSLVTANSNIVCTVQTNDTTLKSVVAVPGSGSVVLTANAAATGETRVGCAVFN